MGKLPAQATRSWLGVPASGELPGFSQLGSGKNEGVRNLLVNTKVGAPSPLIEQLAIRVESLRSESAGPGGSKAGNEAAVQPRARIDTNAMIQLLNRETGTTKGRREAPFALMTDPEKGVVSKTGKLAHLALIATRFREGDDATGKPAALGREYAAPSKQGAGRVTPLPVEFLARNFSEDAIRSFSPGKRTAPLPGGYLGKEGERPLRGEHPLRGERPLRTELSGKEAVSKTGKQNHPALMATRGREGGDATGKPAALGREYAAPLPGGYLGKEGERPLRGEHPLRSDSSVHFREAPLSTASASDLTGRALGSSGIGSVGTPPQLATGSTPVGTSPTKDGSPRTSLRVEQVQAILRLNAGHLARLARRGGGQTVLILHPKSLGRIRLEVSVKESVASASLYADDPAVRAVLKADATPLREALARHGIELEHFEVREETRGRHSPEDSGNRARRGRPATTKSPESVTGQAASGQDETISPIRHNANGSISLIV